MPQERRGSVPAGRHAVRGFESHSVTLVASLILGKAAFGPSGPAFPLLVPAIRVVTAGIGVLTVTPYFS